MKHRNAQPQDSSMKPQPPVNHIIDRYRYDQESGMVYRNGGVNMSQATKDRPIGTKLQDGSVQVMVCGYRTKLNHLVWALHKGEWADGYLTTIDGDVTNTRIENLKPTDYQSNHAPVIKVTPPPIEHNYVGVHYHEGEYIAVINAEFLGAYVTPADAAIVYNGEASKLGMLPNRIRGNPVASMFGYDVMKEAVNDALRD